MRALVVSPIKLLMLQSYHKILRMSRAMYNIKQRFQSCIVKSRPISLSQHINRPFTPKTKFYFADLFWSNSPNIPQTTTANLTTRFSTIPFGLLTLGITTHSRDLSCSYLCDLLDSLDRTDSTSNVMNQITGDEIDYSFAHVHSIPQNFANVK